LRPSSAAIREIRSQVGQILATEKGGILVAEQNKVLMPPTYQRFVTWGYGDESLKLGFTENEKSCITFENVQEGSILCCCAPDSKTIVTAGTSSTIHVWRLGKVKSSCKLLLITRLYGHSDTGNF